MLAPVSCSLWQAHLRKPCPKRIYIVSLNLWKEMKKDWSNNLKYPFLTFHLSVTQGLTGKTETKTLPLSQPMKLSLSPLLFSSSLVCSPYTSFQRPLQCSFCLSNLLFLIQHLFFVPTSKVPEELVWQRSALLRGGNGERKIEMAMAGIFWTDQRRWEIKDHSHDNKLYLITHLFLGEASTMRREWNNSPDSSFLGLFFCIASIIIFLLKMYSYSFVSTIKFIS